MGIFQKCDIKDITIQDILIMNKHKELIKIYFGLGKINFVDDILDELGISEDMRIPKPGKIADYEERDKIVAKALKVVKERKKEEVAAFRKMAQEMREQQSLTILQNNPNSNLPSLKRAMFCGNL